MSGRGGRGGNRSGRNSSGRGRGKGGRGTGYSGASGTSKKGLCSALGNNLFDYGQKNVDELVQRVVDDNIKILILLV